MAEPFADRLAALVEERHSQVCLGLDPDPGAVDESARRFAESRVSDPADLPVERRAELAGWAIAEHCRRLIDEAGPSCVAVKPQMACFERLGAPGWAALAQTCETAREAGLLIIADGKRGDVPVTAHAYADALFGPVRTPWGPVPGLRADAVTANPLLGEDAIEPLVDAAAEAGGGIFLLVRTSNPGAAGLQDVPEGDPLHERLARLVDALSGRLAGSGELSGVGAVVGATAPGHLTRLRELMPRAPFLIPGVGAQGGRPEDLGPAFAAGPASAIVAASRSIAGAGDAAAAAEELREAVWRVSAR